MKQLYDGDHRMFYEAIVVYTALVGYPLRVNSQEWRKKIVQKIDMLPMFTSRYLHFIYHFSIVFAGGALIIYGTY